jgi:hypothetical protein
MCFKVFQYVLKYFDESQYIKGMAIISMILWWCSNKFHYISMIFSCVLMVFDWNFKVFICILLVFCIFQWNFNVLMVNYYLSCALASSLGHWATLGLLYSLLQPRPLINSKIPCVFLTKATVLDIVGKIDFSKNKSMRP